MRKYIDIIESKNDSRDMEAKLLDLINHPTTEPHLRDVAQRKLDKLRAAKQEAEEAGIHQAAYNAKSSQVPAPLFQVNIERGATLKTLPREEWNKVFCDTIEAKRKTTFEEIIDAMRPFGCFKIDFYPHRGGVVGHHAKVWFHPEDEPEDHIGMEKALKKLRWGIAPKATYYRGGTSSYFISPDRPAKTRGR